MPLTAGSSQKVVSQNIRELHTGKTYAHTAGKFGKERANKQAIAIALSNARGRADGGHVAKRDGVAGYDAGGGVDPVHAVISALTQGVGSGAPSGIGSTNPATPAAAPTSAPVSTVGTAPSAAAPTMNATVPATTPIATMAAAPAGTNPATTGVAPAAAPVKTNPMSTPLLADGGVANRAPGGLAFPTPKMPTGQAPWTVRNEARPVHVGPIVSAVPGRTDNHAVKVPAGSYVLPAAHVASMGSGNSMAGLSIASKMFSGPYGTPAPKMGGGHGMMPHAPKAATFSDGGARGSMAHEHEMVPVNLSGGEFVIPPASIIHRFGSLENGHKILDKWVMHERKKEIELQKRLPPPAKE